MTRMQLLRQVDSREISEEIAFDQIEPLPDPWLMCGLICSVMANLWTEKGRKYKPQDFMPFASKSKARTMFNQLKGAITSAGKVAEFKKKSGG